MIVDARKNWILVGACFFIYVVFYGIFKLSGIFFVASMTAYNVERSAASFPYTFASFTKYLIAPLFGYLAQKFGIIKVVLVGCIVSAVGIGICFFAEDIIFVTVFYGIFFGLGASPTILLPVLINRHFDQYRAIASGLSISGISCGMFVLPPFAEFLLNKYGLSGTFLIFSGLVFNCLPAIMLLKLVTTRSSSTLCKEIQKCNQNERQPLLKEGSVALIYCKENIEQNNVKEKENLKSLLHSIKNSFQTNLSRNQGILKASNTNNYQFMKSDIADIVSTEKLYVAKPSCHKKQEKTTASHFSISQCLNKSNIKSRKPVKRLVEKNMTSSFRTILDPIFIVLSLNCAFYMTASLILATVILDFANDIGISENIQPYTLMAISVGELTGPLCLGWIIDKRYVSKTSIFAVTSFLDGLFVTFISFSNNSIMLLSLLSIKSVINSSGTVIVPLLIADYMEDKQQPFALASGGFLAAPLSLLISPLIGFLRDGIGSYEYLFYGLGIISILRGFALLTVPCIWKRKTENGRH